MLDDGRGSIEFDPVRIAPRRRRFDPVLVGLLIVGAGLVLAIAKPWDPRGSEAAPSASGSGSGLAAGSASPSSASSSLPTASATPQATFDPAPANVVAILDALGVHDDWGIGVIAQDTGNARNYGETWVPVPEGRAGFLHLDPITAVHITAPHDQTPLDVRVFAPTADGDARWLDVQRLATDRAQGSLVLTPPRVNGVTAATWAPGLYRIDLLLGSTIRSIELRLPTADGGVANYPPGEPPGGAQVIPPPTIASDLQTGMFIVADGAGLSIGSVPGAPLDAAAAWFDPQSSSPSSPTSRVARVLDPRPTGLGVLFPVDARDVDTTFITLTRPIGTIGFDQTRSESPPFVLYTAPDGGPWPAGVYGIRAHWSDTNGEHDESWYVELPPDAGSVGETTTSLESELVVAARAYAPFAGRHGVVTGPGPALRGQPSSGGIRLLPFVPSEEPPGVKPVACDETFIDGRPDIVGFSRPFGETAPPVITAQILFPDGRTSVLPLLTADLPGLTLARPATGPGFAPGIYRFSISGGGETIAPMVCLGTSPFEG